MFDFIEFATDDLEKSTQTFLKLGFEKAGIRDHLEHHHRSVLLVQNGIRIILSASDDPNDRCYRFTKRHGPGIMNIGILTNDVFSDLEIALDMGLKLAEHPVTTLNQLGKTTQASIEALGDVLITVVSREGKIFQKGFDFALHGRVEGYGLTQTERVTFATQPPPLSPLHLSIQQFIGSDRIQFRHEDTASFLTTYHGEGVLSLSLRTDSIHSTLEQLKKEGLQGRYSVPPVYYEELLIKLPDLKDKIEKAHSLGLLFDGQNNDYSIHWHSLPLLGGVSVEIVEHHGTHTSSYSYLEELQSSIEKHRASIGVVS